MKNIFKKMWTRILMSMILITMLTGCGLNGTYQADGLIGQSFTFMDDNKVKLSAFDIDAEGTYEIKDGKIIITYSVLGFSYDWEQDYQKIDQDTISIGGTLFNKVQ